MGRKKVTIYKKIRVQVLLRAGLTYANIRNRLGVSNGCISNAAEKEKLGLPLQNRRGQGRKKLTTDQEGRYLLLLMKRNRRKTSRQLVSEWMLSHGKVISPQTVRRRLVNAGYKSYTTKRKPYRKASHRHIRFQFSRAHYEWTFNDWKHAIFSDESHFEVFN